MKPELLIESKNEYLVVTAKGKRTAFSEIAEGALKAGKLAEEHKAKYILADYREIIYDIPLSDAFNLIKVYEKKVPSFSRATISVVTNKESLEVVKYWESIGTKRGFNFKVFTDFNQAEKWLLQAIKNDNQKKY